MNGGSRNMDVKNDVKVNVVVSDPRGKGAAKPPPYGGPPKLSEFPGDLQRRKRDSEKISRNENKKKDYYMMT